MIIIKNMRNDAPAYQYDVWISSKFALYSPFCNMRTNTEEQNNALYDKYFKKSIKINADMLHELDILCNIHKKYGILRLFSFFDNDSWCDTIKRYILEKTGERQLNIYESHLDIFDIDADYIINPVNCKGICGKGLALQFKRKFPKMYEFYRQLCTSKEFNIDTIATYENIILFPTKRDFRDDSNIAIIIRNLRSLREVLQDLPVRNPEHQRVKVAIPRIGCGCGGLKWGEVKECIVTILTDIDVDIIITDYKPSIPQERYNAYRMGLDTLDDLFSDCDDLMSEIGGI